jgi:NAD-dependent deacetylase
LLSNTPGHSLPDHLLAQLADANLVMVLSGAGMSAESGIPTFRDAQNGLWARYKPEELATAEAFEADPARVWSWYQERRKRVREARPHAGHRALVALESLVPALSIVTQNVDGLHQLAGSTHVAELHGNILRSKCHVTLRPISEEWLADSSQAPPRSPYISNGFARPEGTTSQVQPAASLPVMALEHGARLVEINPRETPLSLHADLCLRGTAAEVLPALVSQMKSSK